MKNVVFSGTVLYTELANPASNTPAVDVSKTFGIHDAWDFESVEGIVKFLKKELASPRHFYSAACVQAFDTATGKVLATVHMHDPKTIGKEYKEFLAKVKADMNRIEVA